MTELSMNAVIRALSNAELEDAIETCLDRPDFADCVWCIMDELERRQPTFEI